MPTPEQLKNEPTHVFVDLVQVVMSKEVFLLAVRSGGDLNCFIFTPAHAKRLLGVLITKVAEYEREWGHIEDNVAKPLLSPLQRDELGGDQP